MNFPRNYSNMAGPRMFSGPRMAPHFPTYNRSRVHQDSVFAEDNIWIAPVASKDTTQKVLHHAKQEKKNNNSVPKELPKVVEKEPVQPKNPEEKKTEEKKTIENPKGETLQHRKKPFWKNDVRKELVQSQFATQDATNKPQNQEAISQPQNSGAPGAAKKEKPNWKKKKNALRKRLKKLLKATTNNPQNHKATSQPQNSADAGKLQQPMPKDVSVKPEATNPLQPNPSCISQAENTDDKQQKKVNAQNGDKKKRSAVEETTDADLPSQPHKKLKTEETGPPAEQVDLVNKYGLRGDTSAMYSCGLCQYHTLDEKLIQIHFFTYKHKMVMKHLWGHFTKKRVNLLNKHLIAKVKSSLGPKNSNVNLVREAFAKITPAHYLHRIEATQCEACDILIPDVPGLLQTHIQSQVHKQNLQDKFKDIMDNSITAAKELLQDFERQCKMGLYYSEDKAASSSQGHYSSKNKAASSSQGHYSSKDKAASSSQGQRYSKDKAASSSQGQRSGQHKDKAASSVQTPSKAVAASSSKVSTALEILVPEEDEDDDDAADANGQESPVNHNECPVDEKKDSDYDDNMVFETDPVTDGKVKEDETEEEEAAEAP